MKDKNGIDIRINNDVIAYNEETEIEFQGIVVGFKQGIYVTVLDQEDNYFNIEPENIEIQ